MRVGVIRTDLSSPILAADLEQVSRRNNSVDAPGQVRYLSYPTDAALQKAMTDNGATGITVAALKAAVYTGGSIDVSHATISGLAWGANPVPLATTAAIADLVAPQFAETDVAVESFLKGNIAGFASSSFNPDPRNRAVSAGAAVVVLEDDGETPFATANTVPLTTAAAFAAGVVTITGTGLGGESGGGTDPLRSTVVAFGGTVRKTLSQEAIENAGGTITDTSIVVPGSLLPGIGAANGTTVRVQFRQLISAARAVA